MIKIAIVDDNALLIQAAKEKLSFFNDFKVVFTACNGKKLIEKLEKFPEIDFISKHRTSRSNFNGYRNACDKWCRSHRFRKKKLP